MVRLTVGSVTLAAVCAFASLASAQPVSAPVSNDWTVTIGVEEL
jgi:hypothetical protein